MDWIHCNNCFSQLEPGITLHLTSCGHMFCNNCLNNGVKEGTCLVCRMPCSIMKLVPEMSQDIQDYFTDPEELLKKCCEVVQFQKNHRRRFLSYLLQSNGLRKCETFILTDSLLDGSVLTWKGYLSLKSPISSSSYGGFCTPFYCLLFSVIHLYVFFIYTYVYII